MQFQKLALAVVISASLVGCKSGGGGGSSAPAPAPKPAVSKTGTYNDAPTNGLYYVTYDAKGIKTGSGYTGYVGETDTKTQEPGYFNYKEDDTVEFYLGGPGGLLVGRNDARGYIMPQDTASPTVAANTARLLLSVNESDDDAVVEIPDSLRNVKGDELESLAAIDLGALSETEIKKILVDIQAKSLVPKTMADVDSHLTNTTKDVRTKRAADEAYKNDPLVTGLSTKGKITRIDILRLSYGSGDFKTNCYIDLTKIDKDTAADKKDAAVKAEVEKRFASMVYNTDASKDGVKGAYNYEGSHDTYGRDGDSSFSQCELDAENPEDVKRYGFKPKTDAKYKAENKIDPNELNGFSYNAHRIDVDKNLDGSYEIDGKSTHSIDEVKYKVADGEILNQRNVYSYAADAGIIFDTQTRYPVVINNDPSITGELVDNLGTSDKVWIKKSMTSGEEWLGMTYFYTPEEIGKEKSVDKITPKLIDLTGEWIVKKYCDTSFTWCSTGIETETISFSVGKYIEDGDKDDSTTYAEEAYSDMWFFRYNELAYGKSGVATLQQLNSRVKWTGEDGHPEAVRWSYIPAGKDGNEGILYRYKEGYNPSAKEFTGTIFSTTIYTRAKNK